MHLNTNLNTFAFDWHSEFLRFGKWDFNTYSLNQDHEKLFGVNDKQINPNHYCRAFSLVHISGNEILGVE